MTVTYVDGHTGDILDSQTIDYGSDATPPTKPEHTGYKPGDWDKPSTNITEDTVITVPYSPIGYIIKFDKNASCEIFPFFTENQNTTISGDGNDMPHWTISSCSAMNELSAFHEKSAKLYENQIMAIYAEMAQSDSAKVEELNAQVQPIIKEYFDYQVDFIKSHSDSYIGHFMLDQMKRELDFELVKELAAGFTNESAFSKSVQEFIENGPQMETPCCTVE